MQDHAWEAGINAWDEAVAILPFIKGNIVIRSKDKRIICVKLNGGVDLPWKKKDKDWMTVSSFSCATSLNPRLISIGLIGHFTNSFDELLAGLTQPVPPPGEFDHHHHDYSGMTKMYTNKGGADVWHFALWYSYDRSKIPRIFKHCVGGSNTYQFEAVSGFLNAMAFLRQAAANLFLVQT